MKIDIHVHASPNDVLNRTMEERMGDAGIGFAVLQAIEMGSYVPSAEQVRKANDRASDLADSCPERFAYFMYLNPQLDDWETEFERNLAHPRCKGVKLWTTALSPEGSPERSLAVMRRAAVAGLPVLVHVFNRTDAMIPGEVNYEAIVRMARAVPECIVIAAHVLCQFGESAACLDSWPPNLYVDISGGFPEDHSLEVLVKRFGADRILYGSDALGRSFVSQVAKVHFAPLSEEDREKIYWRNAASLLHLTDLREPEERHVSSLLPLPDTREEHFVFTGRWPFRNDRGSTPAELDAMLGTAGFEKGYAANLDDLFSTTLIQANDDFFEACCDCSHLVPLATVNPACRGWYETLHAALHRGFSGVWISPYLHNWSLNSASADQLAALCLETHCPVWLNVSLGDYRFRHTAVAFRPVDLGGELAEFLKRHPDLQCVVQGVVDPVPLLDAAGPLVRFDLSHVVDYGLKREVLSTAAGRLVWGTEYPLRPFGCTRFAADVMARKL